MGRNKQPNQIRRLNGKLASSGKFASVVYGRNGVSRRERSIYRMQYTILFPTIQFINSCQPNIKS